MQDLTQQIREFRERLIYTMLATRAAKVAGMSTYDIYQTMYSDEDRKKVK